MTNSTILNAIKEIEAIEMNQPSDWLEVLKESAIDMLKRNNGLYIIDDDYSCCEMQPKEYKLFKKSIKNEAYFHEQWDIISLEQEIVRKSTEYVDAWNRILHILTEYGIKVPSSWFMVPTEESVQINLFCHYDLPAEAVVGGSWKLPDWYIDSNNVPNAPWWKFSFPEFTAYIKAVTPTDDPDIVEVEYWLYRANNAHCSGYYARWCTCTAMVNTKTHRRWNVD